MNYTSAQANKLLKKLNDEYTALLDKETRSRDFRAAMGEDVESVRPAYDYAETQIRLAELEAKIRKLKHAINIFNATQTVDSFDMTIDELLVYIPQLTKRKSKLLEMKSRLPKERVEEQYGRQSSIIDYTYANYDIAAVEADYEKAADELSRAQLALDAVNQRETFEFEEWPLSVASHECPTIFDPITISACVQRSETENRLFLWLSVMRPVFMGYGEHLPAASVKRENFLGPKYGYRP